MGWIPLIEAPDRLLTQAWDAITGIADSVLKQDYTGPPAQLHEQALLCAYLARVQDSAEWADAAAERLNAAIEAAGPRTDCGLFGGLCGLGWTVEHLSKLLADEQDDGSADEGDEAGDPTADIESLVLRELERGRWSGPYDLIGGLVGYGVYFLERLPAGKAGLGLELVVYHLHRNAERNGRLVTWQTSPEMMARLGLSASGDACYNLGVAHGVPGVLHLLSETLAAGIEPKKSRDLLEGGIEWLLAQERPPVALSRFGSWLGTGDSSDTRTAWCYGDLGILAVMQQVTLRLSQTAWQPFAKKLADTCLTRPESSFGASDAALCHGYSGIAHIHNRMYQATGDPRFREAAMTYYARALSMKRPGGGVGGFYAIRQPSPTSPATAEAQPAFLDGSIGIALALLAAVSPLEPAWDRTMLLSGRNGPVKES